MHFTFVHGYLVKHAKQTDINNKLYQFLLNGLVGSTLSKYRYCCCLRVHQIRLWFWLRLGL